MDYIVTKTCYHATLGRLVKGRKVSLEPAETSGIRHCLEPAGEPYQTKVVNDHPFEKPSASRQAQASPKQTSRSSRRGARKKTGDAS